MSISHTTSQLRNAIRSAFETCRETSADLFPNALIPINQTYDPSVPIVTEYFSREMNELSDFVRVLNKIVFLIDAGHWPLENDIEMSVRFRVLAYCHILEADFPYVLLLNLCRVDAGLDPCWGFFLRDDTDAVKLDKKGLVRPLPTIQHRLDHLKRYKLADSTHVVEMVEELWSNDIRNAFAHSQYIIDGTGELLATKWLTDMAGESGLCTISKQKQTAFPFDEIKELHARACDYMEEFVKAYHDYITPFKEAPVVELTCGRVRWNSQKSRWEPR